MDFYLVSTYDSRYLMGCFLLPNEVRYDTGCQNHSLMRSHYQRPRSMIGGDLHWIWEPYGLYQEIDYVRRIFSDQAHANLDCILGFNGTDIRRQGSARK